MSLLGFSIEDRAKTLNISLGAYFRALRDDARIFSGATLPTEGAVDRLRHWFSLGCPQGDLDKLCAMCDPRSGQALVTALEAIPAPVRHFAIDTIVFFGIDPRHDGWSGNSVPSMPNPAGDVALTIVFHSEDPAIVAHEIAHGWFRRRRAPNVSPLPFCEEMAAGDVEVSDLVAKGFEEDLFRVILREEIRADAAATAWGFPINSCGLNRHQLIRQEMTDAQERSAA